MAKREQVVLDCDRCPRGRKPVPATEKRSFAVGRDRYELDLCDAHAASFDRDMGAWSRLAREVTPQVHDMKTPFRREREAELAAAVEPNASRFRPEPSPDPNVVVVQKLPARYHLWSLTQHAIERCAERGISQRDALIAASDPNFAHVDAKTGYWLHRRDDLVAVVNRNTNAVITVMSTELLAKKRQEREEAHA